MFGLLEKLLAFILEAMKDTPSADGEVCIKSRHTRKILAGFIILLLFMFAGVWTWYETEVKGKIEIYKLKERQNERIIADLQFANGSLKEERIRISAKLSSVTDKLTETTRNYNLLTVVSEKAKSDLSNTRLQVAEYKELNTELTFTIDKLQSKLDGYTKDTRLVWDEIITLGKKDK